MKFLLSKYILIGSLRTRITVIFSLLTLAVQLAFYMVVNSTTQELRQSHAKVRVEQVSKVVPTLIESEYRALDAELLQLVDSVRSMGAVDRSDVLQYLVRRQGDRLAVRLLLHDSAGELLHSSIDAAGLQEKLLQAARSDNGVRSGYISADQAFLSSSYRVQIGSQEYWLTASINLAQRVLPALDRIADVNSTVVADLGFSGNRSSLEAGKVTTAVEHFPGVSIKTIANDTAKVSSLIRSQDARLQILLAMSLTTVLLLGMALANELTKPLKLLVKATKNIQDGDYTEKVPMVYRDEIGELARTIDIMRERVGLREEKIMQLAYADTLTGLPNRALFDDRLNYAVKVGKRKDMPFAVLMLDMNRFKYINDVLGHEAGDHVLKEVAERLQNTLRESDTVARLGGDEFALLLLGSGEADILSAVEKVSKIFEQPVSLNNQPVDIGCSIGIARYPVHGDDASTLLRRADMAMYSAKRADKTHAFYDLNCDEHREEHLSLLSEIKRAIELDELQLFFQPKVTFGDSSVLSVETLLRWQHPERGLIPPDEFIPFAEQTGAIRLITRWVVAKALCQAGLWREKQLNIKMSLNISARDLLDAEFSAYVKMGLIENNVEPGMICMEITESALMEDPIKARRTVEELHELGVSISIDDYGTGYSSLAYVKNLPVNELKIDREFIKNMLQSKEDVAIVRSTIELGHNLGLKVVAEGIEREEEMQLLKKFGCDQAQGYLISRALSLGDMERWMEDYMANPNNFEGDQEQDYAVGQS